MELKNKNSTLFQIYELYKVEDNKILLKRKCENFCTLCNRSHESDNGYLEIDENTNVYFHCRRNKLNRNYWVPMLICLRIVKINNWILNKQIFRVRILLSTCPPTINNKHKELRTIATHNFRK